jgi:hypothetical protein
MNTRLDMNNIDVDSYCTCSQMELTYPLDIYSCLFLFLLFQESTLVKYVR